jgi:hypothetical protein
MHFVLRWADYEHDGSREEWKIFGFLFQNNEKLVGGRGGLFEGKVGNLNRQLTREGSREF